MTTIVNLHPSLAHRHSLCYAAPAWFSSSHVTFSPTLHAFAPVWGPACIRRQYPSSLSTQDPLHQGHGDYSMPWEWHWWVYPSDTLQWPPIFHNLSFSLHHRSSDIHCADATFPDHCTITTNYTHRTVDPVPHRRPPIWPMNHVVIFSFLSLFPFTRHILLWPDRSQVIALRDWDLTIHFATHKPCAHFTYCLYLRLLYLLWKTRKFSPELRLKFVSSHCFASLRLTPSLYLVLSTHFALLHHTEPPSCTTSHSLILHQETISLLSNCTPQNHIGYTLRSPSPLIFVAS